MMNKKWPLFLSVFLGILIHISLFFWLNQMTFKKHIFDSVSHNLIHYKKDQLLKEIFNQFASFEDPAPIAAELITEYAPPLEIAFPEQEPTFDFFSFEQDAWQIDPFLEAEIVLHQGSSLLTPDKLLVDFPPQAEFTFQDEGYESFGPLYGSEEFDIQVEYAPKRFRPGYVFKITLLPRTDAAFKRIHQNYYFILDRSNSIPRGRYTLNKIAVAEALPLLSEKDHFNILVFDSHVTRLADKALPCTKENIVLALEFLEQQGHGGYFAATELYSSLGKIIPANVAENEVNTAILLSDGDTYLSNEKQRLMIGGWTLKNQGRVSLFCAATGTGNNVRLLELLSAFNKGHLVYAADHMHISERLKQLIRSIQNPIGKDMFASALASTKHMAIILQPKQSRLPNLYQNRPFIIYGSTNRLSDFTLFLQGKYYNTRFDIKKTVTFEKAQVGSPSIERQWTALLVQEFYEHYFEDGNIAHLETAKQILSPLNLPTAFME